MVHHRIGLLASIIIALTANICHASKGKVGTIAQLNSDDVKIRSDLPIKNVHVIFDVVGHYDDLDTLKFIQALEIRLYNKGFSLLETPKHADVILTLKIEKIMKDVWIGLPTTFGSQKEIRCLSVKATYETDLGEWSKEFIAHKGFWTYTGDAYYRDTTTNDLARAIVNPLHDYPKEKAFIEAAGKGDLDAVRVYINDQINIDADNDEGDTALIAAARNGQDVIVELLIAQDADVNAKNLDGMTALSYAAMNGDEAAALVLLSSGARVNTEDFDNLSPLDHAVVGGHAPVVRLLLANGSRVGRSLDIAKERGNKELARMLSEHEEKERQAVNYDCGYLSGLIKNELNEKIEKLLDDGDIVIDPLNDSCRLAMMTAAQQGNVMIIDTFLDKGFDVDTEDGKGDALLIKAAEQGRQETVAMLLSHGADLERYGGSALAGAVRNGQKTVVEYLLSQMVDINAPGRSGDTLGRTPLSAAARAGRLEMIELLLSKGADVNSRDNDGKTPLMSAALSGNIESVNFLLTNGADMHQPDRNGQTVLDLVSEARANANTVTFRAVYDRLKREERRNNDKSRTLRSTK